MKRLIAVLEALLLLTLTPPLVFAQTTQSSSSKPLVFAHVTVIDATGAPAKPDMTVIIKGERIAALDKSSKVRVPKSAQVIDATGKFLIPGLWDMHVHLSFYADTKQPPFTAFPALIANGVTGARDVGGDLTQIDKWRQEIADGTLTGPRIFRAGPFLDGPKEMDEFRASRTIVVTTPEEARAAVRKLKQLGVDLIKAHNGLSRAAYLALADECRKRKIPLATHLPTSVRIAEASDAGTHSIEHIEMLTESIMYGSVPGKKSEDPVLDALAELTDEKANALFARFAKNKTWYTPTLVAYHTFLQEAEENVLKDPAGWKAGLEGRRKMFDRFKELVGMMQRAGVGLLAGTDFSSKSGVYPYPVPQPGTDLHAELAYFVESGLTPLEALQTATLNPAKWFNLQKDYGTVERGKRADLVLLNANPLENIKNTQSINAVIVDGRYLSKEMLQKMLTGPQQ